MNRRKLFGILPMSLLGLAAAAKGEPAKADGLSNLYVEHTCGTPVNSDGSPMDYPSKEYVSLFKQKADGSFLTREEHAKVVAEEERSFDRKVEMYDAAPICGQKFRHIRGAKAICPKCGENSYSSEVQDLVGIPC